MTAATNDDHIDWVDPSRSACLCDVGQPAYWAVSAIGPGGEQRLILARRDAIGDTRHTYDPTCSTVSHEQLGELPIEFVRRLAVASRALRCGRPTCRGRPCRIRVDRPGSACEFHRDDDRTTRHG